MFLQETKDSSMQIYLPGVKRDLHFVLYHVWKLMNMSENFEQPVPIWIINVIFFLDYNIHG